MTNEEYSHDIFIKTGIMTIKDDGTIWRNGIVFKHGKSFRIDWITPRRAEMVSTQTGYLRIPTKINQRWVCVLAHRLVYYHFNGEIPDGLVINHKNGDKQDNHPCNLEAVTQGANNLHRIHVLGKACRPPRNPHLVGLNHPQSKFTKDEVIQVKDLLESGITVGEVALKTGRTITSISSINNGRTYKDVDCKDRTYPLMPSPFDPRRRFA